LDVKLKKYEEELNGIKEECKQFDNQIEEKKESVESLERMFERMNEGRNKKIAEKHAEFNSLNFEYQHQLKTFEFEKQKLDDITQQTVDLRKVLENIEVDIKKLFFDDSEIVMELDKIKVEVSEKEQELEIKTNNLILVQTQISEQDKIMQEKLSEFNLKIKHFRETQVSCGTQTIKNEELEMILEYELYDNKIE